MVGTVTAEVKEQQQQPAAMHIMEAEGEEEKHADGLVNGSVNGGVNGDLKHRDGESRTSGDEDEESACEEEKRDELGILMEGKKQIQLHSGEVLEVGRDPRPPDGECCAGQTDGVLQE